MTRWSGWGRLPVLLFGGVTACVAKIGDPAPMEGPPPPRSSCEGVTPFGDPGRVRVRRLSGYEYDRTVGALLDDTGHPAANFPADSAAFGFDNLGEAQSIPPALLEQYATAAERLVTRALEAPPAEVDATYQAEQVDAISDWGVDVGWVGLDPEALYFIEDGWSTTPFLDLAAGRYEIRVVARAELLALAEPAEVRVRIGGKEMARFWFAAGVAQAQTATVQVDRVYDQMEVGFTNWQHTAAHLPEVASTCAGCDQPDQACVQDRCRRVVICDRSEQCPTGQECLPDLPGVAPGRSACGLPLQQRRLFLDRFSIRGPLDPIANNATRDRLLTPCRARDESCARSVLAEFGRRAFRRPLSESELSGLLAIYRQGVGEGEDLALGAAMQAILLSPNFLFRVEDAALPGPRGLSDLELATRLSYFLWSAPPDDRLLEAAEGGRLRANLRSETTRMLADPKAEALVESFLGQWLGTRILGAEVILRAPAQFPDFDPDLQASMLEETERFFQDHLVRRRPLSALLQSDRAFIDARLAAHYGVTAPPEDWTPVSLASTGRGGGLLTQAGILTLTGLPSRTSIVRRGKWVLDNLLCLAPPPPPPGVEGFPETIDPGATLRARMEMHRSNPSCAGCHAVMDPLGFALEEFDAIGRHRTTDENGLPVDVEATLPDGRHFSGGAELAAALAADRSFHRCVAQKLATYAVGRGFGASDLCDLEAILDQSDGSLPGIIEALVVSPLFGATQGDE